MKKSLLIPLIIIVSQIPTAQADSCKVLMSYITETSDGIVALPPKPDRKFTLESTYSSEWRIGRPFKHNVERIEILSFNVGFPNGVSHSFGVTADSSLVVDFGSGSVSTYTLSGPAPSASQWFRDPTWANTLENHIKIPRYIEVPGACPTSVPISATVKLTVRVPGASSNWGHIYYNGTLNLQTVNSDPLRIRLDPEISRLNCVAGAECTTESTAIIAGNGTLLDLTWGAVPGVRYRVNGVLTDVGVIQAPTPGVRHKMVIALSGGPGQQIYSIPVTVTML